MESLVTIVYVPEAKYVPDAHQIVLSNEGPHVIRQCVCDAAFMTWDDVRVRMSQCGRCRLIWVPQEGNA